MPSFDEMLKDMPMHYSFYIRGVMNSVLPDFMNPIDRDITEKNISGEAIELFRAMAQHMAPDLKDGEIFQGEGYMAPVAEFFGDGVTTPETMSLNRQIRDALGNFGLTKVDGEYVIFDTYDFNPNFSKEAGVSTSSMFESLSVGNPQPIAQRLGEILMPDTDDDNMKVRIRIPNEPSVIDVDYDDDIPEGAEDFVFRGPMTNKRKSMFDAFSNMFISEANAGQLDTDVMEYVDALDEGPLTADLYRQYEARLAQSDGGVRVFDPAEMMGLTKGPTRQ